MKCDFAVFLPTRSAPNGVLMFYFAFSQTKLVGIGIEVLCKTNLDKVNYLK